MEPSSKRSPTPEHPAPEDPDTAAARKELKHTVISDKPDLSAMSAAEKDSAPAPNSSVTGDKVSGNASTPDRDSAERQTGDLRDQVSSPKKKRAHDEVDEPIEAHSDSNGDVSPIGTDSAPSLNRTDRSEPEKKRPRDVSSESKVNSGMLSVPSHSKENSERAEKSDKSSAEKEATTKDTNPDKEEQATTSASAFSNSGIAGFASQASPFLQAASKPLSSFASPSGSQSPFGAAAASKSTTSVFGGSSLSNGASPFGQVAGAPKPFGNSAFGSFGSKIGGSTLTSFGKSGESFKSNKPAKPFGAPVSEEEDNGEDGNSEDEAGADTEEQEAQGEKTAAPDDKKKPRLQRVAVDDGEAGEVTILQVRAKIYHLDKASSAWKERGSGNLKINVPTACIEFDEVTGTPVPGTFDASCLGVAESKVVRLVMRQDSTHRVILNTAIIPAMEFKPKTPASTTQCVLFTAIEDGGAVSIQLKMNVASAKSFLNEVEKIQRELQSV
ncbi:hypothetical protein F5Y05DRAFT_408528 [Hypoxylon sp. FL0543]|nr:hypothetical protein F5Y05DRAFT_408528 [Hypoxylon sp. FL0543]